MSSSSRRAFLANSSFVLAGVALGVPRWMAAVPMRSARPVSTLLPEIMAPDTLRELALAGIDAARQPDVRYADIRVANIRELNMAWNPFGDAPSGELSFDYSYGVRVNIGGTWGFAFGTDPTIDGVARAARSAVVTARGLARLSVGSTELAPAPVVQGTWEPNITIDPFDVSPDDHARLLSAYLQTARRVLGGGVEPSIEWSGETRVFASSEGSLITQRLIRAVPRIKVTGQQMSSRTTRLAIPGITASSLGFELLTGAAVQDRIKALAEEAVRLASYPQGEVDVGRYEAVIDGQTFGNIVNTILIPALEMNRVLGYEADGAGTSFLTPPSEILGQAVSTRGVNIVADRRAPYYGAAKWDDEGVETTPFPIIAQGRVVNYLATRDSAPLLAEWYTKQGMPVTSHGAAISCGPTMSPVGTASNLLVNSDERGPSLDDMIKRVSNGILVRGMSYVKTDSQLSGGSAFTGMLFEVKNGQITRRLLNGMVQLGTKSFLKHIVQLGNAGTVEQHVFERRRGESLSKSYVSTHAPAAYIQQLDVIRLPKAT